MGRALGAVALCFALLLVGGCSLSTADIDGRVCEPDGSCLPGYVCEPTTSTCVREQMQQCNLGEVMTCGTCDDNCTIQILNATPVCDTSGGTGVCDYSACNGTFQDADGMRGNGCECQPGAMEVCNNIDDNCDNSVDEGVPNCQCDGGTPSSELCDGIDNDCNALIDDTFECISGEFQDCDAGSGPTSGFQVCNPTTCTFDVTCTLKDAVPPAVVGDLSAVGGEGQVSLGWTNPPDTDLDVCIVRRTVGVAPATFTDGVVVTTIDTPASAMPVMFTDDTAPLDMESFYGVYCTDASGNTQEMVVAGVNVASATAVPAPPARVINLTGTPGDTVVDLQFNAPPMPVTECVVVRKDTTVPVDHTDGTVVGTFTTAGASESVNDTGLSNDTTYGYAVFCRNGSTWNDTVAAGENALTSTPVGTGCGLADDLLVEATPLCDYAVPTGLGKSTGTAFIMTLTSDCNTNLSQFQFTLNANSDTVDADVQVIRLVHDQNDDGDPTGDPIVVNGATLFAGNVVLNIASGFAMTPGQPERFFVIVTPSASATRSFFSIQLADPSDVTLTGSTQPNVVLDAMPLETGTVTLLGQERLCTAGAVDNGAGTFAIDSAQEIAGPNNSGMWASGAGDESDGIWTPGNSSAGTSLGDCDLDTPFAGAEVSLTDEGNGSVFFRVDTGIPTGLPLCSLSARLYASELTLGSCDADQLNGFQDAYLFAYDGLTTVAANAGNPTTLGFTDGPSAGGAMCNSHFTDIDLLSVYQLATAAGDFELRLILDEGGGIAQNNTLGTRVGELTLKAP